MLLTSQNWKILIARNQMEIVSDKKISEKGIASAAELLYKGAKMLAHSCPECKMPLFEKDGKIFCPSCGREVVIEEDSAAKAESEEKPPESTKPAVKADYDEAVEKIEMAISKVCDMMVESRSVEEVRVLSDSLEKLVDALKKLRE
jgi:UPF0148 protein